MAKIELELRPETIQELHRLAKRRKSSIERVIEDEFGPRKVVEGKPDQLLGIFSDEQELVDAIVQHSREIRSQTSFRLNSG